MAKSDSVVARIDADIARLRDIEAFVQGRSGDAALMSGINDDLVKLQEMRAYVTQEATTAAEKPKRTRGKNKPKPGLPAAETGL